jgi:hypothetical protein
MFDLDTSPEEQERAARLLLTLADDGALFPRERDSAAEVYFSLAQFFANRGDFVSAYTALELARARSDRVHDRDVFLKEVERLQHSIAAKVRVQARL